MKEILCLGFILLDTYCIVSVVRSDTWRKITLPNFLPPWDWTSNISITRWLSTDWTKWSRGKYV